eukprot:5940963-Pleurochrysis_carterae.AAC.1
MEIPAPFNLGRIAVEHGAVEHGTSHNIANVPEYGKYRLWNDLPKPGPANLPCKVDVIACYTIHAVQVLAASTGRFFSVERGGGF